MNHLFAVFGNPIHQSKSPFIHQHFAKVLNISLQYEAILAPIDGFSQAIDAFIHRGGQGANVTAPFKQQAFELCDALSERAQCSGAVNTLTFKNQKIYGDNTDGQGLITDLTERCQISFDQMKILIIGCGGATRGIVMPLLQQNIHSLTVTNRSFEKAEALAAEFRHPKLKADALQRPNNTFDLIINASSASLTGEIPSFPDHCFDQNTMVYDLTYSSQPTPFMQHCLKKGCKQAFDGLGMLIEQAAESFFIWHQQRPNTQDIYTSLRAQLNTQS